MMSSAEFAEFYYVGLFMNVFDFDNTIFSPDSSFAFCRYCLRHYARYFLKNSPQILKFAWEYCSAEKKEASALKEQLFAFLKYLPDPYACVDAFWEENISGIKEWYLAMQKEDDVIISASPEFLLTPVAKKIGFQLIATQMNPYSGAITGLNCHDAEKVRRFRQIFPDAEIDQFYSDSLTDAPLAKIAKEAFLVKGNQLLPWPE